MHPQEKKVRRIVDLLLPHSASIAMNDGTNADRSSLSYAYVLMLNVSLLLLG